MKIEGTKIKPTREKIPEGFSPVDVDDAKWGNEGEEPTEESINKGLVIQDESGNQFVWVPVEKDQKIKINVTSKEDIESITLTDPYGENKLTVNNDDVETSYSNENIEPTINGPYVLNVKTASEEKNFSLY